MAGSTARRLQRAVLVDPVKISQDSASSPRQSAGLHRGGGIGSGARFPLASDILSQSTDKKRLSASQNSERQTHLVKKSP